MNFKNKKAVAGIIVLFFMVVFAFYVTGDFSDYFRHEVEVTILHTNDIHGHFMPTEAHWLAHSPPVGGFASLATFYNEEAHQADREARPLLLFDAGDWFTGAPESDLTDGEAMIAGFNQLGYDFLTIGNHEFDVGVETLIERIGELKHPVVTSNIFLQTDTDPRQFPGTEANAIIERKGIKFGIFGLVTESLRGYDIDGVYFENIVPAARRQVKTLSDSGADVIIAITHIGLPADKRLADSVNGIDVIVGSHTHSRLTVPEFVNNTIIVQAGGSLSEVGRLDVRIDSRAGKIRSYDGGLISLMHRNYRPDTVVAAALAPYLEEVDELLSEPVGYVTADLWRASDVSSPLGNLITDSMRLATGADIAFQNSFGIRDSIPAGEVTMRHMYRVLPFGNELVVMELSGQQVRALLEQSATMDKGVLQLSGAQLVVDNSRPRGNRVVEVEIAGEGLVEEQKYKIVTNSFLAGGGDLYKTFSEAEEKEVLGKTLREALVEYFKNNSPVEPPHQKRYRRINQSDNVPTGSY